MPIILLNCFELKFKLQPFNRVCKSVCRSPKGEIQGANLKEYWANAVGARDGKQ